MLSNTNGTNPTQEDKTMKRQTPIVRDSLEQMRLDCVALRRKLGLPGGQLTEEQQKIYLEAKRELWLDHNVRQQPQPSPVCR